MAAVLRAQAEAPASLECFNDGVTSFANPGLRGHL
jgi:hypothetical protein